MATIAIFGGTGYAGSAIRDEALRRGHRVISVTRSGAPDGASQAPNLEFRQGTVHDAALVDRIAAEADVIVISIRFAPTPEDVKLIDAFPALTRACAAHGTRLGVVGGAASLDVAAGGPRLIDTPEFPDAFKPEAGSAASTLDALRRHHRRGLVLRIAGPGVRFVRPRRVARRLPGRRRRAAAGRSREVSHLGRGLRAGVRR
jgi:uncharacterized protein